MKWIIFFILAGAILSQQSGCKDDTPPRPLAELEKLPPATNTGKQKFGCLINGKAFVPNSTSDVYAVFQQGILQISGETDNPLPDQWITMILVENKATIETGTYNLTTPPYEEAKCWFSEACFYNSDNIIDGSLTITHFDRINYIISGTFDFSAVAPGCDTLKVSDGRFDIKYVP